MKAQLCPVCKGSGVVSILGYSYDIYEISVTGGTGQQTKLCHGCDGKGWVQVRDFGDFIDPIPQQTRCFVPETTGIQVQQKT